MQLGFCEGNQSTVKSAPYNSTAGVCGLRRGGTEKEMGDVNLEAIIQLTIGLYLDCRFSIVTWPAPFEMTSYTIRLTRRTELMEETANYNIPVWGLMLSKTRLNFS
jgi:hypothetical protein